MVKVNDQVTHRYPLVSGQNWIRTGKVCAIEGEKAVIKFSNDPIKKTVPVSSLEPISRRFSGRHSVHPNPTLRNNRG